MLYILNYMVYALQLLQLTTFWVICVTVNIKKCPVLARMQAWIRLHQWLCNGIVHSSPHRQSDAASNRSHPALLSGNSLLQYAADVVNWIQVMAVQRPQIWGDERMVVGFTQLFLMMSLQTLQTKIAVYDMHYRRLRETSLSRYLVCGRRLYSVSSYTQYHSHIFFNVYVQFGLWLPCLQSVLHVSHSLLSNVSSPSFVHFYTRKFSGSLYEYALCSMKLFQKGKFLIIVFAS